MKELEERLKELKEEKKGIEETIAEIKKQLEEYRIKKEKEEELDNFIRSIMYDKGE